MTDTPHHRMIRPGDVRAVFELFAAMVTRYPKASTIRQLKDCMSSPEIAERVSRVLVICIQAGFVEAFPNGRFRLQVEKVAALSDVEVEGESE